MVTFGLIIALFVVSSVVIFATVHGAYQILTVVQKDQQEFQTLSKAVDDLYLAAEGYSRSGKDEYQGQYLKLMSRAQASLALLSKSMPGDLVYDIKDLSNMLKSFDELGQLTFASYRAGVDLIYINRQVSELSRLRGYIRGESSRILSEYMDVTDGQVSRMRAHLDWSELQAYVVLLLVTVTCVLLALSLTRDISGPLHGLVESLEKFAAGDFDVQAPARRRRDEIASLIHSFNSMTVQIKSLVEEIQRTTNLETALKQSELESLQAWINPHFLFNTLNSISVLADLEQADRTRSTVLSLAELLRNNLNSAGSKVALQAEFASVEHYLKIQKVRFGDRLAYQLRLEPGLERVRVPGMILQPFVENAVIHGLEPLEAGGNIVVEARRDLPGPAITLEIRDSGTGFDPQSVERDNHAGTRNTARRLELHYGRPVVTIVSEPGGGTSVQIRIPQEELLSAVGSEPGLG